MEEALRSVFVDVTSLSFRWFIDVEPSPGVHDFSFMPSTDALDEETFIEIDLGIPPSKGIRVISVPMDYEFSFPRLGSATPLAHADELFAVSHVQPSYIEPPNFHGSIPPRKNPSNASKPVQSLANDMIVSSSMGSQKPSDRIITTCLKSLKLSFKCFRGRKPRPKETQDLATRNTPIHPEKSSSAVIGLAEWFLKTLCKEGAR